MKINIDVPKCSPTTTGSLMEIAWTILNWPLLCSSLFKSLINDSESFSRVFSSSWRNLFGASILAVIGYFVSILLFRVPVLHSSIKVTIVSLTLKVFATALVKSDLNESKESSLTPSKVIETSITGLSKSLKSWCIWCIQASKIMLYYYTRMKSMMMNHSTRMLLTYPFQQY